MSNLAAHEGPDVGKRMRHAASGDGDTHSRLPPITVVVCTRDRPDDLQGCLAALRALDYPECEVVVVDNASSSNDVRAIVERSSYRYEREDRPGLDWARCHGARVARHDIIAYTDDDVRVDPSWLRGVAQSFDRPAVLAMTGLVLPLELATPAQQLYERYGTGMSRGLKPRNFVPQQMSWRQLIETQAIGVGANMAFRRHAFAVAGEFDTALDVGTPSGGGGDLDMFRRILRAGGEMRYEPAAIVRHRHRRELPELAAQLRANGRSYGVYLLKAARLHGTERAAAIAYAFLVWLPWLASRLLRGLVGAHPLPPALLWAELRGALESPGAYRLTYARDRELRRRAESCSSAPHATDEAT